MDERAQKIINLCQHLFGETKAEVKKNNQSVDKLICLFKDLNKTPEYAEKIYYELLQHPDDKVRFEAATCCLKLNKKINQAKGVLKSISKQNPNLSMQFSAEMILDVWNEQGKLDT